MSTSDLKNLCCSCCEHTSETEIEFLIRQLKREVEDLMKSTEARLLIQDNKIAETCLYLKNNLTIELRHLLDSMKLSGELDKEIIGAINSSLASAMFYDVEETKTNLSNVLLANKYVDVKVVENDEIGTSYIVTKVKTLKPCVQFTNGSNENPYSDQKNVIDYMKSTNKIMAINSGLKGVTVRGGVSFIENNTSEHECWYTLGITEDGEFKCYKRSYTATQIIGDGCRDAVGIWSPLIQNSQKFDVNLLDSTDENYDYIINQRHPRQAIGRLSCGTYVIVTCDGRMVDENGLTFGELQQIMIDLGCIEAYNLDGGASTQLVVGKQLLSRKLSKSRTVGTVFTFESEVKNNVQCYC